MEQFHQLDYSLPSYGKKWKVIGATDYEIRKIIYAGLEITVKCLVGNPLRIKSFDPAPLPINKDRLFKDAETKFNDSNIFDYQFNCHSHSFLISNMYWFDDDNSLDDLINFKYKKVISDLYKLGDIALFCNGGLKVHSARYYRNGFTHKKGPEKVFQVPNMDDFKSIYEYDKVCHLRPI
jgi:hypothetical protein